MTHDELLAKVDDITFKLDKGTFADTNKLLFQSNALRAVVELHKPVLRAVIVSDNDHFTTTEWCELCNRLYPCKTIQAIEKELGGN